MKINLPQVKTVLSVCLKLSQSKNILFHLNSIGYTCYSCDRIRRGLFFFIVSAVYTSLHKIPIKIHCLSRLSIFGGLSKNVFFQVKLLFTVCFILSQFMDIFSSLNTTVISCYS